MNKAYKIVLSLLCVIFLSIFLFSGYKLYSILHEYKVAEDMYNGLSGQYVSTETEKPEIKPEEDEEEAVTEEPVEEEPVEKSPISVDFDTLLATSKFVKGWLYSADTPINYPLAQADDNFYYLDKFIDGTYNPSGTIFLDCQCPGDFSGRHTILYGHNMNDGSMLASIRHYWKQEYFDAHPVMYMNTPSQNYKVEIFSGYITSATSDTYTIWFSDDTQYMNWINKLYSQSNFLSDTVVTAEDRIITLSTCTYEYDDARYVLHGKLVPIE